MSELQAIEAVVQQYFHALHEANAEVIQRLFVAQAEIFGYYEGELIMQKLPEYLHIIKRMSAPNMLGEDFDMAIAGIDTIGQIAHARVRYLFQALYYTEYLSLLKIDGDWRIVNKTFHHDIDPD